jgi:hypothetical protein
MNNGSHAQYAIRVAGRLGATTLAAFPDLAWEAQGSDTVLTGEVRDGSALYGIVALLDSLGLELIEVKRLAATPAGPSATSGLGGVDEPRSGPVC